jgi:hypothetical protein
MNLCYDSEFRVVGHLPVVLDACDPAGAASPSGGVRSTTKSIARTLTALAVVLFSSFALDALEKEKPMELKVVYRTVKSMDSPSSTGKRGRRRSHHSSSAWTSVVVADVPAAVDAACRQIPSGGTGLSGLRTQRLARSEGVRYTFDHIASGDEGLHASAGSFAVHALHAGLRRTGWFSHGIGPSGTVFRR